MTAHECREVLRFFAGSIALAWLTFASFRPHLDLAKDVRPDLVVVLLCPRRVDFVESAVVSLIGGGCLTYLFASPIFSLRTRNPFEVGSLISVSESHGCRFWSAGNPPRGASFLLTLSGNAEASE
jgi:hypothetical protein